MCCSLFSSEQTILSQMQKMSIDKNMDAMVQFMMSALLFELYKIYIFTRSMEGVTIFVVLALAACWCSKHRVLAFVCCDHT